MNASSRSIDTRLAIKRGTIEMLRTSAQISVRPELVEGLLLLKLIRWFDKLTTDGASTSSPPTGPRQAHHERIFDKLTTNGTSTIYQSKKPRIRHRRRPAPSSGLSLIRSFHNRVDEIAFNCDWASVWDHLQ